MFINSLNRIYFNPEGEGSPGGSLVPTKPDLTIDALEQLFSEAGSSNDSPSPQPAVTSDVQESESGNEIEAATPVPSPNPVTPTSEPEPTGGNEPGVQPAPQTPQEAELAMMKSQLEQYKNMFNVLQQNQQMQAQPQNPTPEKPSGSESADLPEYNFTIPDNLMLLLDSEDPVQRRYGVGALAQGVAQTVHKTIMEQVQNSLSGLPDMINEIVSSGTAAQQTTQDFYAKYPELDKPELHSLVKSVGMQVVNETKADAWSPQLRDLIAQRTFAVLNSVRNQQPGNSVPPSAPPNMVNGSGGTTTRQQTNSIADEIESLNF